MSLSKKENRRCLRQVREEVRKIEKIFVPHELKTVEIDVEKRKFKINGEDFGKHCTGFTITALEFHEAMKAHCIAADKNCEACCMRLYCYTPPCERTDSMIRNVLSFLESQHIRTECGSRSDRHTEIDPMPCPCSMDMSTAIGYEPR